MTDVDRRTDGDTRGLRKAAVLAIEQIDGGSIVRLAGELDLYNAPAVREALAGAAAEQPRRLVVDLSEVEFIDSTALGVLIEARAKMADGDCFLLANPGLETRRALEISGLDRHFTVHETVDDAVDASNAS